MRIKDALLSKNRKGLIDMKSYMSDSPTSGRVSFPNKYPSTKEEAILRSAKEYRWDISFSADPIKEYIS